MLHEKLVLCPREIIELIVIVLYALHLVDFTMRVIFRYFSESLYSFVIVCLRCELIKHYHY
jgi:hypothetical protein